MAVAVTIEIGKYILFFVLSVYSEQVFLGKNNLGMHKTCATRKHTLHSCFVSFLFERGINISWNQALSCYLFPRSTGSWDGMLCSCDYLHLCCSRCARLTCCSCTSSMKLTCFVMLTADEASGMRWTEITDLETLLRSFNNSFSSGDALGIVYPFPSSLE